MNGMITTNGSFDLEEVKERISAYKVTGVVLKTTTKEKYVLPGEGKKVALMDFGAKKNIARELNKRGCEVTVYPADTPAEEVLKTNPDGIMLSNGPGDPAESFMNPMFRFLPSVSDISSWLLPQAQIHIS